MSKQSQPVSKPFAEFGVRLFALVFDLIGVVAIGVLINENVLAPLDLRQDTLGYLILIIVLLYFVLGWSTPLRATPGQLLAGIRVVGVDGQPIGFVRAVLRSVVLALLIAATWSIIDVPQRSWMLVVALLGYAAVFLAAVTPNRQGLHDIVVRSIVITRKTLNDPERLQLLLAHVADRDAETLQRRRPAVWRTILDAVIIALPAFGLFSMAQLMHDREMITRTYYAYDATETLRTAVAAHYELTSTWPTPADDIGVPAREDYPDGGYYELGNDGEILIYFEVLPELTRGVIVLTPVPGEEVRWKCRQRGTIRQAYLPPVCRGPSLE